MRNDGSNGSGGWLFTEEATPTSAAPTTQSSWADFDGDQDLDLLLVHIAPLTETGLHSPLPQRRQRCLRRRGDSRHAHRRARRGAVGRLRRRRRSRHPGRGQRQGDRRHLQHRVAPLSQRCRDFRAGRAHRLRLLRRLVRPLRGLLGRLRLRRRHRHPARRHLQLRLADRRPGQGPTTTSGRRLYVDSGNQLPAPRAMGFSGGSFSWLDIDGEGDLDYFIAGSYFVPGRQRPRRDPDASLPERRRGGEPRAHGAGLLDSQVLGDGSVALWWSPATTTSRRLRR
jgi:hypothetical protein